MRFHPGRRAFLPAKPIRRWGAGLLQHGYNLLEFWHLRRRHSFCWHPEGVIEHLDKNIVYFIQMIGSSLLDVFGSQKLIEQFLGAFVFFLRTLVNLAGNLKQFFTQGLQFFPSSPDLFRCAR